MGNTAERYGTNFLGLYLKGSPEEKVTLADDIQQQLFSLWLDRNEEELNTQAKFLAAAFHELKLYLSENEEVYANFRICSLMGTIENFVFMTRELSREQAEDPQLIKESRSVKQLPRIVELLESHAAMTHGELSENLGVGKSTLTDAMSRIIEVGVVRVETYGRYKMYSLTDKGIRIGKLLRREKDNSIKLDDTVEDIKTLLQKASSRSDRERIADALISAINATGHSQIKRTFYGGQPRAYIVSKSGERLSNYQWHDFNFASLLETPDKGSPVAPTYRDESEPSKAEFHPLLPGFSAENTRANHILLDDGIDYLEFSSNIRYAHA